MRTRFLVVTFATLVFTAHIAVAQQPPPSSPSTAPQTSQPSCPPSDRLLPGRVGVVTGLVVSERGQIRNGIMVRLTRYPSGLPQGTPPGTAAETKYAETDADARFTFEGLPPDCYVATIAGDTEAPSGGARFMLPADAGVNLHLVTPVGRPRGLLLLGLSILVYVVGLLGFRRHNIVVTNRELLRAQLKNIQTRIPLETDRDRADDSKVLTDQLEGIHTNIEKPLGKGIAEFFFWSRGREIASWNRLHEVERQLIAFLVPEARVMERAVTAEASLRGLNTPPAVVLADRIRLTLAQIMAASREGADHAPDHLLEHLKQQLAEGLTMLYSDNDTKFAGLMEWHNRAMWLVYLSLLVIAVIAIGFRHEELFLIGAAGGLMSRMARTLFREDVPSDYGASWTTLFLSPLLGAISAWFGVALIVWLTEMRVLGDAFERISWCDTGDPGCGKGDPVLIAMAFTLGFSERLFTSLLSAVESKMDSGLKGGTSAPAPPPAPVTSSGIAGGGGTTPSGGAAPIGAAATKTTDLILSELDVTKGERVAVVGGGTTPLRTKLAELADAENVFDVTVNEIESKTPLDAVLIDATDSPLTVDELTEAAKQIPGALRDNGRVVIVARTPAALFDADVTVLTQSDQVGPALAKERLANDQSGLVAQEPPAALGGTDPIEWMASFVKRAPGGADR